MSLLGADHAFANDPCEYSSVVIDRFVPADKRLGEYRVLLKPPDWASPASIREHAIYATAWSKILSGELARATGGRCVATIGPSLFPDLHVILMRSSTVADSSTDRLACKQALQERITGLAPSPEVVGAAAMQEAALKHRLLAKPRGAVSDAANILIVGLAHVYDGGTVMHALVTVMADPAAAFQSVRADALLHWLARQKAEQPLSLTELPMCPLGADGERTFANDVPARLPYSAVAPPGAISLTTRNLGPRISRSLRRAVLVSDGRHVANSVLRTAATVKYCNKVVAFAELVQPVHIRCLTVFVYDDAWTVFFCDPKDCGSEEVAEAAMATIAGDPDVSSLARRNAGTGQPRGPYLVRVVEASD